MANPQGQGPKAANGLQRASGAAMDAARMGKAAALIAKGAAAGGVGGAAAAALKDPKAALKLAGALLVLVMLPILLIALLPLVIFNAIVGFVGGVLSSIGAFFRSLPVIGTIIIAIGSLFGGGAATEEAAANIYFDNAFDTAHIVYNLEQAHEIIGGAHFEQYQAVFDLINNEIILLPEGDEGRIIGIEGDVFQFNTSVILGLYAASLYEDVMQISLDDLRAAMSSAERAGDLFGHITETEIEQRLAYPDPPPPFEYVENPDTKEMETPGWVFCGITETYVPENWIFDAETNEYGPPPPVEVEVTVHSFIVVYNGEMIFAEIFGIADDQRLMAYAHEYARNLMTLLTDTDMGGWFGIILEAGEVEGFYSPFPGMEWRISSPYGYRTDPFTGNRRFHYGIDIPKPTGTPIRAIAGGYVTIAQFSNSAGLWVRVDHGDIPGVGHVMSEYMHNSRNLVSVTNPRTWVDAGQVIGEVGSTGRSTGPHLHLQIRVNGELVNPVIFVGLPPSR